MIWSNLTEEDLLLGNFNLELAVEGLRSVCYFGSIDTCSLCFSKKTIKQSKNLSRVEVEAML